MSAAQPFRGQKVDIGGRSLRIVCEGPKGPGPTVLFEAGAFSTSADWASVQEKIAPRIRSCAYDRAGLGLSDPGPEPRDSAAVVSDLRKVLAAVGEKPPYILAAHSMGPVHAYLHAAQFPQDVVGMVLVDGGYPHAPADPGTDWFLNRFRRSTRWAPLGANLGLFAAIKQTERANLVGLTGQAEKEKRNAFASPKHNFWAAREVAEWPRNIALNRAAGEISDELPIAVVLAGPPREGWTDTRVLPSKRSKHGYYKQVEAAAHQSVLGPRFNDEIVKAIDFVMAEAAKR